MSDADAFAPPPFKPDDALPGLKRALRELGLTEREGKFERKGLAVARLAVVSAAIQAARVRKPLRSSPQWQESSLKSGADVRDFVADLKKQLALWSDQDD